MASSNCWRCLSRPTSSLTNCTFLSLSKSSFSTTAILAGPGRKPGQTMAKDVSKTKGTKTLKIKKKAFVKTGKPPAAGERKAMRKRIVLSNTNALEVADMRDLDSQMVDQLTRTEDPILDGALMSVGENEMPEDVVGSVVGLKGETVDSLRAVEAFKTTQGWGLFRRPGLLVREESVELCRKMVETVEKKKALRLVIDGEKGSGKSLMLLQAMATAFVKGWVVLNIPEAQEVTNAVNDYSAIPGTNPTLWSQNTYTANWLGQIGKANNAVLQNIKMSSKDYKLPIAVQPHITLAKLLELGARDPDVAWPIFQAFWSELTLNGKPPVLFCLDSLSNIMQNSLYRAPDYSLIHSHDLAIVRHFADLLSGNKQLPNGGAILAATSRSHAPISKSMELAIKQAQEKVTGFFGNPTLRDPFEQAYDPRADAVLQSVEVLKLKGLSKAEARGLMEYWAKSGVLRSRVDEETVAEKWALAGNGIVGEIQRSALWMRI